MAKLTKQQIISRVKKETGVTIDMFRQTHSWVMVFDDPADNVYETETVYCMWLADQSLENWVDDGVRFANRFAA